MHIYILIWIVCAGYIAATITTGNLRLSAQEEFDALPEWAQAFSLSLIVATAPITVLQLLLRSAS